jgi:type I restriction enzyme S subunit
MTELRPVGDIFEVVTGNTPSSTEDKFYGGGIPFVRPGDLDQQGPIENTETTLTEEGLDEARRLPEGTVLVSCIGNLGKVGILGSVGSTNQQINALLPTNRVLPKFAYYWAKTIRTWLEQNASATTVSIVNKSRFSEAPFPVMPLSRQRRIVAKLDALTSRAQKADEYLSAIPPLVDTFRQSVLARAFTGELTADWRAEHPDVEPASELLERIKVERKKKWIDNYARNLADRARKRAEKKGKPFTDDDWQAYYDKKVPQGEDRYEEPDPVDPEKEGLPEIPETWEWATFGTVAEIATNLKDPTGFPDATHLAPNYVESGTGRLLDCNTVAEDDVTSNKHHFFPGQIVYSKIRPYLRKAVLVDFEGLCSADMYPIDTSLDPNYLLRWMLSPLFTRWVSQEQGRTVLPKVNIDELTSIRVPVAPIEEQQAVTQCVNQALSFIERVGPMASRETEAITQLRSSALNSELTQDAE